MGESSMNENDEELDPHRLIDLTTLARNHSVGDLASAIEDHGIVGWDRYGRQRHFEKGSPEALAALNGLAEQYTWEGDPSHNELSPIDYYADFCAGQGPRHWPEWGWYADELPDIGPIVEKPKRQSDKTRSDDIVLSVLDALALQMGLNIAEKGAAHRITEIMGESDFKKPSLNTIKPIIDRAIEARNRRAK
jgi:hypothetical protein